jgi:hypothetical protein
MNRRLPAGAPHRRINPQILIIDTLVKPKNTNSSLIQTIYNFLLESQEEINAAKFKS